MKSLRAMQEKIEAIREEMRKSGAEAIKEALTEFFGRHSMVASIQWRQYTPYFNDGDQCVFAVHDPEITFREGVNAVEHVSASTMDSAWKYSNGKVSDLTAWNLKDGTKLKEDLQEFASLICNMGELMETVFGDHMQITCYPDRIEADEYSHD